jgi:hypothetical protein
MWVRNWVKTSVTRYFLQIYTSIYNVRSAYRRFQKRARPDDFWRSKRLSAFRVTGTSGGSPSPSKIELSSLAGHLMSKKVNSCSIFLSVQSKSTGVSQILRPIPNGLFALTSGHPPNPLPVMKLYHFTHEENISIHSDFHFVHFVDI